MRAVAKVGKVVEGTERRRVVEVLPSKTGWAFGDPEKNQPVARCELPLGHSDWPGSQWDEVGRSGGCECPSSI